MTQPQQEMTKLLQDEADAKKMQKYLCGTIRTDHYFKMSEKSWWWVAPVKVTKGLKDAAEKQTFLFKRPGREMVMEKTLQTLKMCLRGKNH